MSLVNSTNPTNLVGLRPNASRGLAQGPKRAAVNSWLIMVVSGDGNGGWRGVDIAFKQRKINERQSGGREEKWEEGARGREAGEGGRLPGVLTGRREGFARETIASLRPTLSPC